MPDPYADNKKFLGSIFILLSLVLAFAFAYYNSAKSIKKPYQVFRDKYYKNVPLIGQLKSDAEQVPTGQVLLQKNVKFFRDNACLVFKGFSQKKVKLDLYILEFDPDIPFSLSFTKESFSKGVLLNNTLYTLISLKKNKLYLRFKNSG